MENKSNRILGSFKRREAETKRLSILKWIVTPFKIKKAHLTSASPRLMIPFILCFSNFSFSQTFHNAAPGSGISHTYGYASFGGGLSFFDFDKDGWDDLTFASQEGHQLAFFRNVGGQFEKIDPPFVVNDCQAKQVLWSDIDNDGDYDLFVTCYYGDNSLYINDGNFLFSETVLPAPDTFPTGPTYGAAIGDYDLDGSLDIFVCNKIESQPIPNQLFRNNGDGSFEDVTANYFLNDIYQATFCASFVDINNDLLPDIYTAEDKLSVNQLYKNTGQGQFENITSGCGAGVIMDAMCVATGDFDNDNDFDIYVSNTPGGNALFRNNGNETFTDIAPSTGVGYYLVGWGSNWLDYDNDMDLDLYVSGSTPVNPLPSVLYVNLGSNYFIPGAGAGFVGDTTFSFSNALGDYNNDGWQDIAISNMDPDSCQLWSNSGAVGNWLKIKLNGVVSNRDGIGSRIEVYSNGTRQIKYTACGEGYLAQNSATNIFGLGPNYQADSVIIRWPSGMTDQLFEVGSGQLIAIDEGSTLTTSFNEIVESGVIIFPNPFTEILQIQCVSSDIEKVLVFDNMGILIKEESSIGLDELSLSLGFLESGVYFINITSGGKNHIKKVLKL